MVDDIIATRVAFSNTRGTRVRRYLQKVGTNFCCAAVVRRRGLMYISYIMCAVVETRTATLPNKLTYVAQMCHLTVHMHSVRCDGAAALASWLVGHI